MTRRAAGTVGLMVLVVGMVAGDEVRARPSRDVLFQVSTIDALMAGLYDGRLALGQLRRHGDFGLGTLTALDGEMVAVDGRFYQVTSDSVAHRVAPSQTTPFAAVTFFDRDQSATVKPGMTLVELQARLDRDLPSANWFYAIRIDGTFRIVKTRSVPRQQRPYRRLVDVVAEQPTYEFHDVAGTLVGFRCPYFVKSVNVPGYHFHFLTADRARGGHVLDCVTEAAVAWLDTTPELHLALPDEEEFRCANLGPAQAGELEKVEKDR